jgi:hypothetical protein
MGHSLQGPVDLAQFGIASILKDLVERLFLYIGRLVEWIGRQNGVTQPLSSAQRVKKKDPSSSEEILS